MKKLLLLFALLLAGCTPPIRSGKVIEKNFTPAHTEWSTETINIDIGNGQTISSPVSERIPDRFALTIMGENDEGQMRTRTLSVTREEYHAAIVGQTWPPLPPVE